MNSAGDLRYRQERQEKVAGRAGGLPDRAPPEVAGRKARVIRLEQRK